jgi:hypothetical protein
MRSIVLEKRANASRPGALQPSLGDIRTITDAPSRKTMLSEKSETDRISTANINSRQKKNRFAAASSGICLRKLLYFASLLSATWMDLVARVFRGDASGLYSELSDQAIRCPLFASSKSDTDAFSVPSPRLSAFHSNPGAFIAQIAAMNTAFARGRMVRVSVSAVRGQTVMLTQSGQRKLVSANKAIGTTM